MRYVLAREEEAGEAGDLEGRCYPSLRGDREGRTTVCLLLDTNRRQTPAGLWIWEE